MKKLVKDLLYKELSYRIQGAAIEVRKDFGSGHKEQVYQKAFEEELKRRKIKYRREESIKIYSPKDGKFIGLYRPDFVIDNKIVIEIKAEKIVPRQEFKRMYDYLRNSKYELGYFINFASSKLYIKRIIFTNDRKPFLKNNPLNYTNKKLKNTKLKLLVLIGLILVSISGISSAKEEVTLGVHPPIFELNLKKGQVLKDKIIIWNRSNILVPLEAVVTSFTAADEFGRIQFEKGDITDWFKIEKPGFILKPGEGREVNFQITIPEDVERGGCYGVILFKSKLPSYYFEKEATKAIPQIGVLFLISVGEKEKANFEIVEFGISDKNRIKPLEKITRTVLVKGSYIPFILRVKNNDIYHIKPSGSLKIYKTTENSSLQNIIGEAEIKETTILPGKIRQFPVEFYPALFGKLDKFLPKFLASFISENLFFGKYQVLLKLHGSAEVEKEMALWIIPLKGIITLLLLTFSVLFIMIKYKKQLRGEYEKIRKGIEKIRGRKS